MTAKPLKPQGIRKVLPRTLFGRSLLILLLPVLLLQIITTVFFFERHWSVVTRRLTGAVAGDIAVAADEIETLPADFAIDDLLAQQSQNFDIGLFYERGKALPADESPSFNPPLAHSLRHALHEQVRRPFVIALRQSGELIDISVALKDGVLLAVVPQHRLFTRGTYVFLLWMIGSSVVLSGISLLFMRNQIRPIRRLAVAAERFGKGGDVSRFRPEGAAEVRQAAIAFIEMRDRIRRQMTQRTEMLAGVSHDLRTPLTRMKLLLALQAKSPDTAALLGDVEEMETMVEGYLAFARGEEGEALTPTDLAALIEEVAETVRRSGGDVETIFKGRPLIAIRPQAIRRALANLMENARRYAGRMQVTLASGKQGVEIVLDDNGPGIPVDEREDVFRPFYRVEDSRNSSTGGVGLGLPIARDIVQSHGGDIVLGDSALGGLRVTITLPG
jgi:two-component system osmolarity sensor histidine kinase EnvZ